MHLQRSSSIIDKSISFDDDNVQQNITELRWFESVC